MAKLVRIQKRVDANDPVAIDHLAHAYFDGKSYGLQQDIQRAIELWTEAVRLGNFEAHCTLGRRYYEGDGVDQDKVKAIRHWQHAAIQGHPLSRHNLGHHEYVNGNHELAVQHWMISAKMGQEDSLHSIKVMFMKGYATKAQYSEALRGYQDALEETKSPQREEMKAILEERNVAFDKDRS